ncbi:MAG TPA: type VI secretion system baseplate subunit TssF [Gammaproteobacteria bacterium]|jgi:type VI secretion system protein ImpG|nr:type VI secretion system baseplate subunit TssF [Gammaproteobacteria bacterium]
MKRDYYQTELSALRELATEFAAAHPALASRLSGPSPDPDVERILEGVAFLTGRVREKLDDEFPELAQTLIQLIYPHYLRPLPASTIIEFKPRDILRRNLVIPAGTYLDSIEVKNTSCRFRTSFEVKVSPLVLTQVQGQERSAGRRAVELTFQLSGVGLAQWDADRLPFYIGGDFAGAVDLYMLLRQHLDRIVLVSGEKEFALPASALQPLGLDDDEAMLPRSTTALPAFGLLQEYFLLKEKFLFLELQQLERWQQRGNNNQFRVRFEFKPTDMRFPSVDRDRFILHATPAVNLFRHDADPILLNHRRAEVRVRPAGENDGNIQVYSVDEVIGHTRGSALRQEYKPIHLFGASGTRDPYYDMRFMSDAEGGHAEPRLLVAYPPGVELPAQQTLILGLTCSNGRLPSQLRPGDISRSTSGTSDLISFHNVLPPADGAEPPMGEAVLWRLLSHLALNFLPIADADTLRALLGLYVAQGGAQSPREVANQRRIASISQVAVKPADRLLAGSIVRGQEIRVNLRQDHFASPGDLYLFGVILDRVLATFATLNSFTAFSVKDEQTGSVYAWPPRLGKRPLI